MARRPEGRPHSSGYSLGFGFTALILGGMTLFLVLVVLPRRYVLNAGLRESGVNFPAEAAPFAPPEETRTVAPPPPPPPPPILPGPAEVFWAEVGPLLEAGRYRMALPFFLDYLDAFPEDQGVLREYALTLQRVGREDEALEVYGRLLARRDDPGTRLLLARGLRDRGRLDEAEPHYLTLLDQKDDDRGLALEWGRALSWSKEYARAEEVFLNALQQDTASSHLRVELARVYFALGRLDEADAVLAKVPAEDLDQAGGASLHAEVIAALTPPEPEEPAAPERLSALDRAALAASVEDFESAEAFYQVALAEAPEDSAAWRRYADLLQYQREDLEGARDALLRLERLREEDQALQFRLAQLETWTGRAEDATDRLRTLVAQWEQELSPGSAPDSTRFRLEDLAEAQAMLGDLERWDGDRAGAGETYLAALERDDGNERALAGVAELEEEISDRVEELERPRFGGDGYSIQDSDEFLRLDFGLEGVAIQGHWVWSGRTGTRRLEGLDLFGASYGYQGWYAGVESARWWKWGTLRTGLHLGLEETRSGSMDLSFGGSLRFSDLAGFRTDLRYDHGPAYPLTLTTQSVLAEVSQHRFTANLARQVGPRWNLSAAADATRIGYGRAETTESKSGYRFEGGLSLGRSLTDEIILGVNARALTYTATSPVLDDLRVFWDPRALFSGGLYAQWTRGVGEGWIFRSRINPSFAYIDERRRSGFEAVPHFSAEAGLSHTGARFRASLDAFHYQGRFDGYRAYGLRLSFSVKDGLGGGRSP